MQIQSQKPTLRHLTTAHLAQTMSLLELTWDDLRQKIENELSSNPALEFVDDRICPTCHHKNKVNGPCPVCSRPKLDFPEQPIVFVSTRGDFIPNPEYGSDENQSREELLSMVDDLPTHILRQIAYDLLPEDRPIAVHLLSSLNDDGLLDVPIIEIAQYHHVPIARIKKILHLIQISDPIGAGSSTPQQALLVQLEVLSETSNVPLLALQLVRDHMDLLSRRAIQEISRKYSVTTDEIHETIRFISENLNPYPGRANWSGASSVQSNPAYVHPDIIISRLNDRIDTPLIVEILSPYAGGLRVNPLFRTAIQQAPQEKVDEWQSALESASLLVKCLQQRDHALVRLMQNLVSLQREFILKGDAWLLPVTRAHVSEELEVHESTISRAVAGKSVQLPNRRIIPLSKMFDRSLHVRTILRQIIQEEEQPLSDTQLALILEKQGFPVARRTVAKYRAIEGILPARFRQTIA